MFTINEQASVSGDFNSSLLRILIFSFKVKTTSGDGSEGWINNGKSACWFKSGRCIKDTVYADWYLPTSLQVVSTLRPKFVLTRLRAILFFFKLLTKEFEREIELLELFGLISSSVNSVMELSLRAIFCCLIMKGATALGTE